MHTICLIGFEPTISKDIERYLRWVFGDEISVSSEAGSCEIAVIHNDSFSIESDAILRVWVARSPSGNSDADVIDWPIHLPDLALKLSRLMQRLKHHTSEQLCEGWQLDSAQQQLISLYDYVVIELTDKETALLRHLKKFSPQRVDKKELLKNIWGYDATIDSHTLETHVYRLRQKVMHVAGAEFPLIVAKDGGYALHCVAGDLQADTNSV